MLSFRVDHLYTLICSVESKYLHAALQETRGDLLVDEDELTVIDSLLRVSHPRHWSHETAYGAESPVSVCSGDESVASHFALVTAYEDIKKRLRDTEKENSTLRKRVKTSGGQVPVPRPPSAPPLQVAPPPGTSYTENWNETWPLDRPSPLGSPAGPSVTTQHAAASLNDGSWSIPAHPTPTHAPFWEEPKSSSTDWSKPY
ncbi:5-azacytidine-induced protein 2 [Bagarius yarrelli]|uniref:5-azacytidine-induced protein 2 n=1 Tax=Bagarius yarrelli TaxID=175774 RepID=A0A556VUX2_BAGYA|nr:5-azacytidine-induced protein 2 [Bagarius yarrelli]